MGGASGYHFHARAQPRWALAAVCFPAAVGSQRQSRIRLHEGDGRGLKTISATREDPYELYCQAAVLSPHHVWPADHDSTHYSRQIVRALKIFLFSRWATLVGV